MTVWTSRLKDRQTNGGHIFKGKTGTYIHNQTGLLRTLVISLQQPNPTHTTKTESHKHKKTDSGAQALSDKTGKREGLPSIYSLSKLSFTK